MEQFTSSSELVAIVGSLTPFLTAFAGAVIGAGAALFGIWTQDRFQRRREATEYIRSIRLKPIDDLSQAIAGGEQILAQFDLIRGNFRARLTATLNSLIMVIGIFNSISDGVIPSLVSRSTARKLPLMRSI